MKTTSLTLCDFKTQKGVVSRRTTLIDRMDFMNVKKVDVEIITIEISLFFLNHLFKKCDHVEDNKNNNTSEIFTAKVLVILCDIA